MGRRAAGSGQPQSYLRVLAGVESDRAARMRPDEIARVLIGARKRFARLANLQCIDSSRENFPRVFFAASIYATARARANAQTRLAAPRAAREELRREPLSWSLRTLWHAALERRISLREIKSRCATG